MFDFAILGGAFNPIHNGHLYIAKEVIKQEIAREVIFMPNGNHPLKKTSLLLPYEQRYHLVELALENQSVFRISNLDSPQYGVNYTYNLIQRISKDTPLSQFTFLIGYDNALNFSQWYQPEWLLEKVNFTVVSRTTSTPDANYLDKRFRLLKISPYDISSSEIRDKLEKGQDISGLVPPQILAHLLQYWRELS